MGDETRNTVRAHGGKRRVEPAGRQRLDLGESPRGHHRLEAPVDRRTQVGTVDGQKDPLVLMVAEDGAFPASLLPVHQRLAGCREDLERAQDALRVARPEA
ncbi:MAG: hypothetical protein FD152_1702 [Xanthobacteraceae bacterium]|nr:MAG: hypothetical protein FD152_1702 [Xanthobacteraceae bacterium]